MNELKDMLENHDLTRYKKQVETTKITITMIYQITSKTFKQFLKGGESEKMSAKEFA